MLSLSKHEPMNDDVTAKIAALLTQVGDIHHMVFADTDGNDDDWATFYSEWLLTHSELPALLGHRPVRSHLTRDLVELDEQYSSQNRPTLAAMVCATARREVLAKGFTLFSSLAGTTIKLDHRDGRVRLRSASPPP